MFNKMAGVVYGKESKFTRKVNYTLRFVENNIVLKMVLDKVVAEKDTDGYIEVVKYSDFITLLEVRKNTMEVDNQEVLEALAETCSPNYEAEHKKMLNDIYCANFPEYEEPDVETYTPLFDNLDAFSDFILRIIFIKRKELFKVADELLQFETVKLAYYLNDLDNIEKLVLSLGQRGVMHQVHDRNLKFYDGRKLKSIVGLPTDIVEKLNHYEAGAYIHIFQEYIRSGRGNVDEVRKLFEWLDALMKLKAKRKLDFDVYLTDYAFKYIGDILAYGCNINQIINAVTREFMMYDCCTTIDINDTLRTISDTLEMNKNADIPTNHICQNVGKWHWVTARNIELLKKSRQDEYKVAVDKINQLSMIVDDYLIRCPETEKELFEIGNRYNNCLPIYRDKIIDNGAIIYSMYRMKNGEVVDKMPPVTFEITKTFDIIQIKTFNDADVDDPDVIEVIKKWRQKAKRKEKQ